MRRIVVAGIRGWGNKIFRCKAEGRRLRRTAKESQGARTRMKLLGKSTWFKSRGGSSKKDLYGNQGGVKKNKPTRREQPRSTTPTPRSVLFVEQTPGGELAVQLRELFTRLAPTLGFYIKVVERTGRRLTNIFPLTNL